MDRINKDILMTLPRVGKMIIEYESFMKQYEKKKQVDIEFKGEWEMKEA
jgi:hypothetical protein